MAALRGGWGVSAVRKVVAPGRASTSSYLHYDGSLSHSKARKAVLSSGKSRWTCRECGKALSSKRSFDEHSNIHSQSRPFACEHCDYAAASQMTLRRHILRNHTPRQAWGYQCPYCPELYMEPASYQQHVSSRHFGKSATFGCPSEGCTFTTRCSGHFMSHVSKHLSMRRAHHFGHFGHFSMTNLCTTPLSKFIVDDKLGVGFGKRPLKQIMQPSIMKKVFDEHLCYEEFMKTPIKCPTVPNGLLENRRMKPRVSESDDSDLPPVLVEEVGVEEFVADDGADLLDAEEEDDLEVGVEEEVEDEEEDTGSWVADDEVGCLEVVVDNSQAPFTRDGMVEFELD